MLETSRGLMESIRHRARKRGEGEAIRGIKGSTTAMDRRVASLLTTTEPGVEIMLCWLRAFAVCLLLATAGAALAAEVKPFAREDMASDAVRLTETLRADAAKIGALTRDKSPDDLRKAASAAAAAGKFDAAEKLAAAAVTAAPKDSASWLAYANVAIKADDAQANDR